MQALVFKKLGDRLTAEIFPEPKTREEPDEAPHYDAAADDGPDPAIVMHDEDGRLLGTAQIVAGVSVYVIGDGYGTTHGELMQCLAEGSQEIRVMT